MRIFAFSILLVLTSCERIDVDQDRCNIQGITEFCNQTMSTNGAQINEFQLANGEIIYAIEGQLSAQDTSYTYHLYFEEDPLSSEINPFRISFPEGLANHFNNNGEFSARNDRETGKKIFTFLIQEGVKRIFIQDKLTLGH